MENPRENFAFWLRPAARERTYLDSVIRDFARRFDGPVFVPHLTLHGGDASEEVALQTLQKIPLRSSYELDIDSVAYSKSFTKTLFVRFRPSSHVDRLRAAIGELLGLSSAGDFDPHLSLLYKDLSLQEKADLSGALSLLWQTVTFTEVCLVAHPVEITSRADVEAWRVIGERATTR